MVAPSYTRLHQHDDLYYSVLKEMYTHTQMLTIYFKTLTQQLYEVGMFHLLHYGRLFHKLFYLHRVLLYKTLQ